MKYLILTFLLTNCTTPNHWGPDSHQDMMYTCSATCGKNKMKSYEPLTGTCECYSESKEP